ncbi:MAG: hypothetical protein NZ805_10990 [Armatimonadetes bacterium]|nr:hypothetical protein [Armatimonadota bacterium]MDW8027748.1 hypothetical protein [Armatimonadota bacterium]
MQERQFAERIPTRMQLHLLVECKKLPEVVEEIANSVLQSLGLDPEDEEAKKKAANAIEEILRKYVMAFEWCGFTLFCQEAKGYDPWKLQEAEPVSWAGD